MASHFNTCVYPYFLSFGSKYYFGIPETYNNRKIDSIRYSIENCKEEYHLKIENGVSNIFEEDSLVYHVESREIYDLGDMITFDDKELYVSKLEARLTKSELIFKYQLKTKRGISVTKTYNKKIIGASLDGYIIDIKNDMVKAYISSDTT